MKRILPFMLCLLLLPLTASGQTNGVYMEPSSSTVLSNGEIFYFMDQENNVLPLFQYHDLTYVPLRAFAERLGKEVLWHEQTETIEITNPPQQKYEGVSYGEAQEALTVSMIQLIANPEQYDGKTVSVSGISGLGLFKRGLINVSCTCIFYIYTVF